MWDHCLTVKCGIEAVSNPTEHEHPEVKLDVIVECPVTSGMIVTEWAKSDIQRGQISAPIHGHVLFNVHPVHGELGHQIMETDVLVLSVTPIPPVYDLAIALLYHPDKVFRLNNWGAQGEPPGWGIAVQALVNHHLDFLHLLFPALIL